MISWRAAWTRPNKNLIPIVPGRGDEIVGELEDIGERFEYFLIYAHRQDKGKAGLGQSVQPRLGRSVAVQELSKPELFRDFLQEVNGNSG